MGIFTLKQWWVCLKTLSDLKDTEEISYSREFSLRFSLCTTDRCRSLLMDMDREFWETRSSYLKAKGTFLYYNVSILKVKYHRDIKKAMKFQNLLTSVFSLFIFHFVLWSYIFWWLIEVLKGGLMCISFNSVIVNKLGKDGDRWDLYMGRQFFKI